MNNKRIADTLEQVADLLEFQGANPFRIRAYRKGAKTIADLPESIGSIVQDTSRKVTDIDGIGKDLGAKVEELVTSGQLEMLEELLETIPATVLDLVRVPGMGPKKAAIVFKQLEIASLEQLKQACENQQLRALKGFGAKTEQTILDGIAIAAAANERTLWAVADEVAQQLLEHLQSCDSIEKIDMAGSYRRCKETIGDLDILVVSTDADEVMDRLGNFPDLDSISVRGDTKMSIRLFGGLQVDLRVVPAESFGAAMQYFTGSKEHNVVVRGRAKQMGLKVNEWGVYRVDSDEYVAGESEEDVYAALDLPWIAPELREARDEFTWSELGELPKLIELSDIRGDLHMHTTATDGKATLEEMAAAAKNIGLKYIAITDHSKRVSMANGLDDERTLRQWDEIDELNESLGKSFTLLKGIECDILENGDMDLSDDTLAQADWVMASIHYGQKQPIEKITRRMLNAIENPHVTAISHPTGRLINKREPYEIDLDQIYAAAKEYNKLLELNAAPKRLDLNEVHCAAAKRHGIPIVISTDAHSVQGLAAMRYGINQARRAGLTKADVANTRTWPQLRKLIGRK